MTPNEMNIVKSLVAVAWADGTVDKPEEGMIESLLWAFGASEDEEQEIRELAKTPQKLDDIPLGDLSNEDREVLLAHAALLTHADGKQTKDEQKTLAAIVKQTGFPDAEAKQIIKEAKNRAKKLASRM